MDRRAFVGMIAGGLLAVWQAARAQPARKVYRIGILGLAATSDLIGPQPRSPSIRALLRGMRELGYTYGEHFVTEPRGADGKPERFPGMAAELVRLQVDVILAVGPALPALKQATSTIPVIMTASNDPVGQAYVQSLGHPGGNITGLSLQSVETTGKLLALLKELVPGAAPVAVIWHKSGIANWRAAEAAAQEGGWKLLSLEIRDADEIEGAFRAATEARTGAVLVFAASVLFPHARRLAELAAKSRLPTMYELRPYVETGGLISYGADIIDIWRRSALYVDKILKGAKPADLPVEQPIKFELLINLKTAKALGLTIPQSLLLRADEVIQ
jgi:putative tryptophan/tyrosine transport system substrate-binding protein